ncbi:MAG: CDP-alcohol phosphatidyltransferase family protein, partial [Deferribacterota bacterium]|nr:CDP-alcohol phosphatidyltransferase family protein [Deferribacterota bacterium]
MKLKVLNMNKDIVNLPNSITLIRLILIPFIMFFSYLETTTGNIIATTLFFVACLTDYFDGIIARQLNSVSDFGKIADQIVDKILVASILIVLVEIERVQGWIVIILIAR